MSRARRVVLLGDVGGDGGFHVGDEAMLAAAIDELGRRGEVSFTVLTRDPEATTRRHGVEARAPIGGWGVTDDRGGAVAAARAQRLDELVELADHDQGIAEILSLLRAADGLVLCGGGNLSASWPGHVYERVALLRIARSFGVPAVVSGQTLGPSLMPVDRTLLSDVLASARWIGLREAASLRVARQLVPGSPCGLQLDDAAGLTPALADDLDATLEAHLAGDKAGNRAVIDNGFVALTVNELRDATSGDHRLRAVARLVRHIAQRVNLPIVFIPHVGDLGGASTDDVAVGAALAEMLGDEVTFVRAPLLGPRETLALTSRAAAVVSSRYHPIVFGLASGVPCLGITQDDYTTVKLVGALDHAGLSGWRLPIGAVGDELACDLFDDLWARRDELGEHLASLQPRFAGATQEHWDLVWEALTDDRGPTTRVRRLDAPAPMLVPKLPGISALHAAADAGCRAEAERDLVWWTRFGEAERYALDLERVVEARTGELDALGEELVGVRRSTDAEIERLHTAGEADRRAASVQLAELDRRIAEVEARLASVDLARAHAEAERNHLLDEVDRSRHSATVARAVVAELRTKLARATSDNDALLVRAATAEAQAVERRAHAARVTEALDAWESTKLVRVFRGPRRAYGMMRRLRRPD